MLLLFRKVLRLVTFLQAKHVGMAKYRRWRDVAASNPITNEMNLMTFHHSSHSPEVQFRNSVPFVWQALSINMYMLISSAKNIREDDQSSNLMLTCKIPAFSGRISVIPKTDPLTDRKISACKSG